MQEERCEATWHSGSICSIYPAVPGSLIPNNLPHKDLISPKVGNFANPKWALMSSQVQSHKFLIKYLVPAKQSSLFSLA